MVANKGKDTHKELQASLIPDIERIEQQIRSELDQVRLGVENQVRQAEKRAEQDLQEGRLSVLELVEQRRKEGLTEIRKRADQLSRSSKKRSAQSKQHVKKNMARAVQTIVDTVTNVRDET